MKIDGESVRNGTLLEDFTPSVNPEAEIDDPNDTKPEDWVDDARIADPEATKPEETVAAPLATEEKVEEPVVPATEAKIAEPIIEGQLGYKAPGLLKYVLSEDLALKRPPTNVSPGSSLSPRRSSGSTTLLSPLRTWVSTSVARSPRSPTP